MAESPSPEVRPHQREYIGLLTLTALVGVPVSVAAWGYLHLLHEAQHLLWDVWPSNLGFDAPPWWWIVGALLIAGGITGFAIANLPGHGGHAPIDGASVSPTAPRELPGILLATFASLAMGAVLGPEAPLIALGTGLGALAVRLANRNQLAQVAATAGSFAALAAVFGSPLAAAFMLMEIIGLGAAAVSRDLLPGLLAAGIGSLVFNGLNDWTGLSSVGLELVSVERLESPDVPDILWSIAIGAAAALLMYAIRTAGRTTAGLVAQRPLVATPIAGLGVALCALAFAATTDHHVENVLLSGQESMGPLIADAAQWSSGALILVILLKGLAFGVSLGSFRGGPVFPAMFVGAAAGLLLADLPGLGQTPAIAAAMGGMTVGAFGAPLSSVLLVTFFLTSAGPEIIAIVIVAVVAAVVTTAILPTPGDLRRPRA